METTQSNEILSQDQGDENGFIDELENRRVKNVKKFRNKLFNVLHEKHDKAVLVNDLFPEFKTKSQEHDFLKSLVKEKIVLQVHGGWDANSTIIFTKEGRDIARQFNIPVMPFIFVSYSHEDAKWKNKLEKHLKVTELYAHIRIWDDTQIRAGQEWKPEIKSALERADAAVLLISADFLASEFIKDEEIPDIFAAKSMAIFPILVQPCAWELVKWLNEIQVRSIEGKALSECNAPKVQRFLAEVTKEIMSRFTLDT